MIEHYYEEFKNERYHDDNLILLAQSLGKATSSRLLFRRLLGIERPDRFQDASGSLQVISGKWT